MLSLLCAAFLTQTPTLPPYWTNPPMESRIRAYWWWLNGNVTEASITRDLEEMRDKGFGGAILCDANGAEQEGNAPVPHGPDFFSPAWRTLYRHTLKEADRLNLEISLNIQSGWNLGGPMVKASDAAKKLVWSEVTIRNSPLLSGGEGTGVRGPEALQSPPTPKHTDPYYQDLFILAYPLRPNARPLTLLPEKSLQKALGWSAPDTSPLLSDLPSDPSEPKIDPKEVIDLTNKLRPDGTLDWTPPKGEWRILRIGCTVGDHARVSTSSDGWKGYAIDPYDKGAFDRYWNAVVEPLIADAKGHPSLRYLHTDSWEVEAASWTPTLRAEFKKRRGYDLLTYLPIMAGALVGGRENSNRFLFDFRRTMGDLAIAHHYAPFRDYAHRHGLLIHPESGGPHSSPIDAQQCLGMDDAPMSEFWARSWTHRVKDEDRFFVKQPASAAHTYGHPLVLAEGFTTIGPHWQETLWNNLKPSFDRALTEGLNRLVWHAFVCSPESEGLPGQQYFAGTHLNPNVTWWSRSKPFFDYLNRCQALLQRGKPVADVLVYYGDNVPNFTQLRSSDPAKIGPGLDYDVITADALLTRAKAEKGRIVMPDGMSYRELILPQAKAISLPVLQKALALSKAGVPVSGAAYTQATGLRGRDTEVQSLAKQLPTQRTPTPPDFESEKPLNWVHRREGETEIYFVSNPASTAVSTTASFRVASKTPELWDAVNGEAHYSPSTERNGRTTVPLNLQPYGSTFVVFRNPGGTPSQPSPTLVIKELAGPWAVSFDPKWGGPASVGFDRLTSWTDRPEPGIRYYSGTATYRQTFDSPTGSSPTWLDLGSVAEIATIRLNGQDLGTVWAPPFRVPLGNALRAKGNVLEIEIINFWPNRIIGDAVLGTHFTKTNVRKLTKDTALMPSGLLGPVTLQ